MSIAGKLGKVIARALTSGTKKLSKEQKAKRKAYLDSYSPKERVKRNEYKKKHGMFPEDDPRNYKHQKSAQQAIKKMNKNKKKKLDRKRKGPHGQTPVVRKAKGGMVVSGVDFVAEQYD
jgi:hypothetical protein|tara:strand:+ start:591 stop:947 length:357 start_codon:yes stop_codon:yes gene_type:complete